MTDGKLRLGILGSGKGSNFAAILNACANPNFPAQVVTVLSDIADAFILERARQAGLPAQYIGPSRYQTKLEPELEHRIAQQLQAAQVGLVVLAGYMRVLKAPLLDAFPGRIINVHPSLLPSFPGLKAWEQALDYGVRVTGCTVHFVNEGIDAGPVILQQPVPVLPGDTAEALHNRIQVTEHALLPEAIRLFASGKLQVTGRRVKISD